MKLPSPETSHNATLTIFHIAVSACVVATAAAIVYFIVGVIFLNEPSGKCVIERSYQGFTVAKDRKILDKQLGLYPTREDAIRAARDNNCANVSE